MRRAIARAAVCTTILFAFAAHDAGAAVTTTTATDGGILTWTPKIPSLSRDCGFSTKLSDGTIFWVFCDSYYTSNTGVMHTKQANSAAFATPASPFAMRDQTFNFFGEYVLNADANAVGGRDFVTLPANPLSFSCSSPGVRKAWPRGVTTVPNAGPNGSDRVLIYYLRVCDKTLSNGTYSYEYRGIGLAQYHYASGTFTGADPVTPTVASGLLNDILFPSWKPFGTGAMLSNDRAYVYVYRCDGTYCYASRVATGSVATASAYKYWNGSSWGSSTIPMSMKGGAIPQSGFNVQWVPQVGKYVMVYTPCLPGGCMGAHTDRALVRTASQPQGPWSSPSTIMLPNCTTDVFATPCNSALLHAEQSTSSTVSITWVRRNEGGAPPGRIHFGTVPLSALP